MVLKKVSGKGQIIANTGYGDDLQGNMALFLMARHPSLNNQRLPSERPSRVIG
jgi:hypothetical protein